MMANPRTERPKAFPDVLGAVPRPCEFYGKVRPQYKREPGIPTIARTTTWGRAERNGATSGPILPAKRKKVIPRVIKAGTRIKTTNIERRI